MNNTSERASILFVCMGNTCRSVLAEYLTRNLLKDVIEVQSAGLRPQQPEDAENAIYILKTTFNIDAHDHSPKNIQEYDLNQFDYVVAMDKSIGKSLKDIVGPKLIIWNIKDPWGDDLEEYKKCAQSIMREISSLSIYPD